ncbi:MAG TPA: nickel-dependent lactate racemase [Gammaproteobacteria bacterium]|mgnify:CR=1 FL=1|nr:nickel-dependent lactate racemase [Gammaproteobacteria bacterium]
MQFELEYGTEGLVIDLPNDLDIHVIRKSPIEVLSDEHNAIEQAFANPHSCAPLKSLAQGKHTACILVCDVTRPVPNHLFLQPMIKEIMQAGIPASGITVLVATGLHRPNEGDELDGLIGDPWVRQTVKVENHFARDDGMHVDLGVTPTKGTPVKLDKRFVEADLKIATGLVEPHFMAGYSGGRKVVAPGIAHEDTIRTFHSARFMEDPLATQCNLTGNPLHEEQLEIVKMLGDVYALNTVIDERRRLAFVNFGEAIASHLEAVAFAEETCTVDVDRRYSTLVTSAAGFPLDKTYYQTVKGMVTPMDILENNANLIVAADCSEGIGSPEYRSAQQRLLELGSDKFLETIMQKQFADIDEWQTEMQLKPMRRASIQLFSGGLAPSDYELTGVQMTSSIEGSVTESVVETGDKTVAIIPEGPYVIPRYSGSL